MRHRAAERIAHEAALDGIYVAHPAARAALRPSPAGCIHYSGQGGLC